MKKRKGRILFWAVLALFLLGFAVKTLADFCRYTKAVGESNPFYVYVLLNGGYFLLPALLWIAGAFLYKKSKK